MCREEEMARRVPLQPSEECRWWGQPLFLPRTRSVQIGTWYGHRVALNIHTVHTCILKIPPDAPCFFYPQNLQNLLVPWSPQDVSRKSHLRSGGTCDCQHLEDPQIQRQRWNQAPAQHLTAMRVRIHKAWPRGVAFNGQIWGKGYRKAMAFICALTSQCRNTYVV